MEYTRLGSSGLKISRIVLGCMSFGASETGRDWTLDDVAAEPLFRQAIELGINFWDTANVYGRGTSEEIVGRAIKKYTRREDVVLATKIFWPMGDGPGGSGLSRRAVLEQVDACLRFVSMQDQYSLVQREEEREMFGLLADQGVGSLP
jgi:aryl-alcohol dehydrogenase-like predicted oxidoreductase